MLNKPNHLSSKKSVIKSPFWKNVKAQFLTEIIHHEFNQEKQQKLFILYLSY